MLNFLVDQTLCTKCGECAADCPAKIINLDGEFPAIQTEMEAACYRCQHCLAICPTAAVSILGLRPEASIPLPGVRQIANDLETLIKGRRSVRRYQDENLEPALINRLLAVAWHAPTGMNSRQVHFNVVDDRTVMQSVRREALARLTDLVQNNGLPPGLEFFAKFVQLWNEKGIDIIFRGAPHLLVTSAPKECVSPVQDCLIALSYFELFAQSLGVGTVWSGLAKWTIDDLAPSLRSRLGIPDHHVIGYAMAFGKPAVSFQRTVQHNSPLINRAT